jgi:CHASE2 domain-containing sensor protein
LVASGVFEGQPNVETVRLPDRNPSFPWFGIALVILEAGALFALTRTLRRRPGKVLMAVMCLLLAVAAVLMLWEYLWTVPFPPFLR